MSRFTKLLSRCCSNLDDPSPHHEEIELDILKPIPALVPAARTPLLHLPRYHHATLSPRMLAPLCRNADFMDGGDARRPLATFSANWANISEGTEASQGVVYEFVYEGECGRTWPLRRIRVDGRVEDCEGEMDKEKAEEDMYEFEVGADEVAGLEGSLGGEEFEARVINGGSVMMCRSVRSSDGSVSKASVATDEGIHDGIVRMARSREEVETLAQDGPKKMRIRIRRAAEGAGDEELPVKLFKVRTRAAHELENESVRRLPIRCDASLVTDNPDGDARQIMYGRLVAKAATVPCRKTSEVGRKDSSRNARWRRIL